MLCYLLENEKVQGIICLLEIELARDHPNKDYCIGMFDVLTKLDLLNSEDENFLKLALDKINY